MPKKRALTPQIRPEPVSFEDIPAFVRPAGVGEARGALTDAQLVGLYRDMAFVRALESLLAQLAAHGSYAGVQLPLRQPLRLAMGQEAARVGAVFALEPEDALFAGGRGPGWALARGLSAIARLSERALVEMMNTREDIAGPIACGQPVRARAVDFLLFGLLSDLAGRPSGFCRGLGGAPCFPPLGIYPAPQAGSGAARAAGAGLHARVNQTGCVAMASLGDGSMGSGDTYESLQFAAMAQYVQLWQDGAAGGLPAVFFVENNHYAGSSQTTGETLADIPVKLGAALGGAQLHAERVDGMDVLAVAEALGRKLELARDGRGPALVEAVTYRYAPPWERGGGQDYRGPEEAALWRARDPLPLYRAQLVEAGVAEEARLDKLLCDIAQHLRFALARVKDAPMGEAPQAAALTYSGKRKPRLDARSCMVRRAMKDNARARAIVRKRAGGLPTSFADAVFEALLHGFYTDPTLVGFGPELLYGDAAAQGLREALPPQRLFDAPLGEAALLGAAAGYALQGGRAMVTLPVGGAARALEGAYALAQARLRSGGQLRLPVVVRLPLLEGEPIAQLAQLPGLLAAYPATPYDMKGLLAAALSGTDPALLLENHGLYSLAEPFREEVPELHYEIAFGLPEIKRPGRDLTLLTVGPALYPALEAARTLARYGVSAEVMDARSLQPFGYTELIRSARRTGRLLFAGEEALGGLMRQWASETASRAFGYLDAAPAVLALPGTQPAQAERIVQAVHERLLPLQGRKE